jgi:hypothetical protein
MVIGLTGSLSAAFGILLLQAIPRNVGGQRRIVGLLAEIVESHGRHADAWIGVARHIAHRRAQEAVVDPHRHALRIGRHVGDERPPCPAARAGCVGRDLAYRRGSGVGREGGNRLDLGIVGERLHPLGIEGEARAIEAKGALVGSAQLRLDPGGIAREQSGRIDHHLAARFGLDRQRGQHRRWEAVLDVALARIGAAGRAIIEVLRDDEHLLPLAHEMDDLAILDAAIEWQFHRSAPGCRRHIIENVGVEGGHLDQDTVLGSIEREGDEAVGMDRCGDGLRWGIAAAFDGRGGERRGAEPDQGDEGASGTQRTQGIVSGPSGGRSLDWYHESGSEDIRETLPGKKRALII